MAFTEAQVKNLEAKLDAKYVRTRRAHDTTLAYVEGWHVIAEANRIFGYDAWDRHTLSTRCVWSDATNHHYAAAYIAKVRIAVRAGAIDHHPGRLWQRRSQGLTPRRGPRACAESCRDRRNQASARDLWQSLRA